MLMVQGRGNRGGGGQWWQLAPTTLKLWRRPPPNFGLSMSFFFFARDFGSLPKNSGPNPGSFFVLRRGYLGSRETFAPPPNFKVVPRPCKGGLFQGSVPPSNDYPLYFSKDRKSLFSPLDAIKVLSGLEMIIFSF